MSTIRNVTSALAVLLAMGGGAFLPSAGLAQVPGYLTSGQILKGSTDREGRAEYLFEASSAGVLTVAARSMDGTDLFLTVADADGQPLPDGGSDQDLGGDMGAEQFAVTLPRGGGYRIIVETFGGGEHTSFQVGVSWLPFPDLEVPADPDGSPSSAIRLRVGQSAHEDSIDGTAGDHWDWFAIKPDEAGTLTVATRTEGGDLVLEAFSPGEFMQAMEHSDQDLQGNGGNEAVTLVVDAGQEFFFKVSAFSDGVSVPYRLQIGFIPGSGR